jgi:hypothetical protein
VRCLVGLLALVGLVALLGACQPLGERSERASDDWSRGVRVGRASANDAVALLPESNGARTCLAWATRREFDGAELLHLAILDETGRVVTERDLDIETNRPGRLQLARTGEGLHLFWIDRLGATRQLHHVRLDAQGWLVSEPAVISPEGMIVDSYAVNARPDGALDILLGAVEGEMTGLYYVALAPDGALGAPIAPLGIPGFDPSLYRDVEGVLHLVWVQAPDYGERQVFYGALNPSTQALERVTRLGAYPVGVGLVGHPPALGLASGEVYAFWSIERRGGGMTPPMADTFYVQFPVGRPDLAGPPRSVAIPSWNRPAYTPAQSGYRLAKTVVSGRSHLPSEFVYFPSSAQSRGEDLAVAFSLQIVGRTQRTIQVAVSYWRDGEMIGYQIVGQTATTSLKPVLAVDQGNDLHLAWIDTAGFGAYAVYYASTASTVQARLNRVTPRDILMRLLNVLWGVVQALGFVPVVLAWGFLPLLVIVIYILFQPEASMTRLGSRLALGFSGLLYVAFKYSLRPGWLMDLPLPPGLSPNTADLLILVTPLLISTLAGTLVWWYGRKRPSASIFTIFGLFVLADALVTLMIYVPAVLGE